MQPEGMPAYLKGLPEPKSSIAKDTLAHCYTMLDNIHSDEDKDRIEREFVAAMRTKYPRVNWQCGRKGNVR